MEERRKILSSSALRKILPLPADLPASSQYRLMGKFKPMAKRPSRDRARKGPQKGGGWDRESSQSLG